MMVNLWDYYGQYVKIIDVDGDVFIGDVLDVASAEDVEGDEDDLSLELSDGRIFGFSPSNIKSIDVLES